MVSDEDAGKRKSQWWDGSGEGGRDGVTLAPTGLKRELPLELTTSLAGPRPCLGTGSQIHALRLFYI